jgi:hypothetical protein
VGRGPGVSSLLSNHGLRVIREYVTANRIGLIMHVCVVRAWVSGERKGAGGRAVSW